MTDALPSNALPTDALPTNALPTDDTSGTVIARVMLESPLPQLDRLFDYAVPVHLASSAVPGVRVKVPLRSVGRFARGFIVEVTREPGFSGTLSPLEEVVSPVAVLTPDVWALARRVADRGAGNACDVVRLAVPPRQVRVEKAWQARRSAPAGETAGHPTPEGAETDPSDPAAESVAVDITGYSTGLLARALAASARLALTAIPRVVEVAPGVWVGHWAKTMAELAAVTLASGRSAILAVPDYRDQEQLTLALAAVVPDEAVAALDARQSNPDRYRQFLSCLDDEPRVIIGNRSVVYAPAKRLGLIAVWDDADPLHREPLSPYASTRDVALIRQEQSQCALVFLEHSRSTEVQRLVELGFVVEVSQSPVYLPHVVPTADQASQDPHAHGARIPSSAWTTARRALQTGPVLIQVARPGYAPVLACASCRTPARCRVCEGPLRLTSAKTTPSCGWCGALAANWRCTSCEGASLRLVSQGTSRTAEELGRAFPGTRVIVSDGERNVLTVGSRPALVVATRGAEPVADGGYAAVLLLDGDRMLARESLTVAEDCLRWWSNAIALAAPKAPCVIVGVGGTLARTLVTWRQDRFASDELADRRRLRFPPAVRVASLTGRSDVVERTLETLSSDVPDRGVASVDVLGPVDQPDQLVRAVVRFDYALGLEVARSLRSSVIKNATGRRVRATSATSDAPPSYRPAPALRVRFDDTEILE